MVQVLAGDIVLFFCVLDMHKNFFPPSWNLMQGGNCVTDQHII